MKATIYRLPEIHGTPGVMVVTDGNGVFKARFTTGEDPWKNNEPMFSCVPPGTYQVDWVTTDKHPNGIYMLQFVKDRFACEIHNGDFFGDVNKTNPVTNQPYISNVEGCIIIGQGFQTINGQDALLQSVNALAAFNTLMGKAPFELEIISAAA